MPKNYTPKDPKGFEKYFTPNFLERHLIVKPEIKKKQVRAHAYAVHLNRSKTQPHIPASTTIGMTPAQMKEFKHYLKDPSTQRKLREDKEVTIPLPAKRIITRGIKYNPGQEKIQKPSYIKLKASTKVPNSKGKVRVGHFVKLQDNY